MKTKWNEVYPGIREDPRLHALLSQPGSSPLDLFRDLIDDLEDQARREKKIVKEIFKDIGYTVTPETTYEDFISHISSSERLSVIDPVYLRYIYESVSGPLSLLKRRRKKRKKRGEDNGVVLIRWSTRLQGD